MIFALLCFPPFQLNDFLENTIEISGNIFFYFDIKTKREEGNTY